MSWWGRADQEAKLQSVRDGIGRKGATDSFRVERNEAFYFCRAGADRKKAKALWRAVQLARKASLLPGLLPAEICARQGPSRVVRLRELPAEASPGLAS